MRILYVSQYYPPEMGAPAARVSELAREWARQGHEVTVLTAFPHHPHGTKRPEDRRVLSRRERDGAVELLRTYVYATKNAGFLKRIVSYLSFCLSAMLIGPWRTGRFDVVIATSPQLFTAIAGRWLAFVKRTPFVFEVRDLWPESIVTVGAMKEGFAIRVLKRLSLSLYRAADRIVTVGEGYRRGITQRYPISPEKIDVVTNGVDLDRFRFRAEERQRIRSERRWDNRLVVSYVGTHGMAHGLDVVLDAANRLRDRDDLRFVFVGDGAEKENLRRKAEELGLGERVEFLPPVSKEDVVGIYAASDICLVPLRKVDLFKEVLPSKIFEIMGMERAMVISVDGDARAEVERAEAGLFAEPENVPELAAAIARLADDPALRERQGRLGRRHVERHFSRQSLAAKYLDLLRDLVTVPIHKLPTVASATAAPEPLRTAG